MTHVRRVLPPLLVLLAAAVACRRPAESPAPPGAPPAAPSAEPGEEAVSALSSGVRLLEQFRHAEAEARFLAALKARPDWLPAQVDLALSQLNQLDAESAARAEASARRAVELAPSSPRAHYVLGYVLAERHGRFADALPHLRRATEGAPDDPSAWFQRARTAEEAARENDDAALRREAREAYETALRLDPKSLEASYRLGRMLLESESPEDAARGEALLGEHQRLIAGRPAVQPNYLTRGALALAHPWERPRVAPPRPAAVRLTPSDPLGLPPLGDSHQPEAPAVERFRGGISVADLDGDGRLDILAPITDPHRPPIAWWGQAAPRRLEPREAIGERGRACGTAPVGDLDRDGGLDVVVSCSTGNLVMLRDGASWRNATPNEMAFTSVSGQRSTLVDHDHDGDLDLHVLTLLARSGSEGWKGDSLLWSNDGKASFHQVAGGMGIAGPFASDAFLWTDFDLDNAVDLVAVLPSGMTLFQARRGAPYATVALPFTMPPPAAGPPAIDLEALDADGDDDPDLVVLAQGAITVLVNDSKPGAPAFRAVALPAPAAVGSSLGAGDLDLDGVRELLLVAPADERGTTRGALLTGGGLELPVRSVGADGLDPEVLAVADVDGDGAPDLVLRTMAGEPVVLWNAAPSAGTTWAAVALAGREGRSNPQAFGAKLTVDAGTLHQRFERRAAHGAFAHVAAAETLGLGGRARVDGLTVLWPSGIQQGEADLAAGTAHAVTEVDRQPSSCPMLYGWDGAEFAFLTDCFDTAPAGLWLGGGKHWAGDPDESLRLRPGWVAPIDGVLNLSVAEFLNETLLADAVAVRAYDHDAGSSLVVDEGVRLAAPPPPDRAWLVGEAAPVRAWQDGRDVSEALRAQDGVVAGWVTALPWTGLAAPHALEIETGRSDGILVLSGSLNFSNSLNLYAASQAGVQAHPARLQVREAGGWRDLTPDCGVPAGFHKDVVVDLASLGVPAGARLRILTNLQVSWDRAAFYSGAQDAGAPRELPLLRAEKRWLGVPREVKGPQDRWRSFPRDGLSGSSPWIRQAGPVTPDGDVRAELGAADESVAFVRPGEEILLAFDDAALGAPAAGQRRTHVLRTHGWVKDATPHTAHELSAGPVPRIGAALYP